MRRVIDKTDQAVNNAISAGTDMAIRNNQIQHDTEAGISDKAGFQKAMWEWVRVQKTKPSPREVFIHSQELAIKWRSLIGTAEQAELIRGKP